MVVLEVTGWWVMIGICMCFSVRCACGKGGGRSMRVKEEDSYVLETTDGTVRYIWVEMFTFVFEVLPTTNPNLHTNHHLWLHNKLECTTVDDVTHEDLICLSFLLHSWHWVNLVC